MKRSPAASTRSDEETRAAEGAALDELYAAPLDDFVSLRKELALRLRASGDADAAKRIAAAVKPTRTAWALNHVAHAHPELVTALIAAWDRGAEAQKRGKSGDTTQAIAAYRATLFAVTNEVRATLAQQAGEPPPSQLREVSRTLGALVPDLERRGELVRGRLTRAAEAEDPFAGLEGADPKDTGPEPEGPDPKDVTPHPEGPDRAHVDKQREHRERLERKRLEQERASREQRREREEKERRDRERAIAQALEAVAKLERAHVAARAHADELLERAVRAQKEADKARRDEEACEADLARARAALSALKAP